MANILIVEPDYLLGKIYLKSLKQAGHEVRWCSQAQQAIDMLDKKRPAVIILELQLADHGGIEFLYECRSYPEWQAIPIIVHTLVPPNLFSVDKQQMEKLGVVQYLYKPSTNLVKLNRAILATLQSAKV